MKKSLFGIICFSLLFSVSSCYSVFSGGTGGLVVDAESTSTPKQGIANVDVYAYIDSETRDSDYNSWISGTKFCPKASYYGHTSTASDGSFTISRIVWNSYNPAFGKDADYYTIYLLFYHENYGLVKDSTIIISDSTSDTVYKELTAIRKTTALNLSFKDVATNSVTANTITVKVSVPQTTQTEQDLSPLVYEASFAGSGTINISYPRWQSETDKNSNIETAPEVTIVYYQSADQVDWKACYNGGETGEDYSFYDETFYTEGIKKQVKNDEYSLVLYGKATVLSVPVLSGQYIGSSTYEDDGKIVTMFADINQNGEYTYDCGQSSTGAQTLGTSSQEKHGVFSALGQNVTFNNETYSTKYFTLPVQLKVLDDSTVLVTKNMELRTDIDSYNVTIE